MVEKSPRAALTQPLLRAAAQQCQIQRSKFNDKVEMYSINICHLLANSHDSLILI